MNEEKIREAYERITAESGFKQTVGGFILFKAGYLALLNSLDGPLSIRVRGSVTQSLYALPEGVTKDD